VAVATEPKVAIVHDWLTNLGGAERVVVTMKKAFPQADIYTSVYQPGSVPGLSGPVQTSFLQNWPLAKRKHQLYPTLRPLAFESFDFSDYDIVITSASAEAKGIITPTETLHVSYIHTPARYYWSHYDEYLRSPGFGALNPLIRLLLPRFVGTRRKWDYAAAQRADIVLANSQEVQKRIKKYYKRDSIVLNPPVDESRFKVDKSESGDYFLVVSRLIPYKRVDLAVRACTELGEQLIVVGTGPELKSLQKMAGPTVKFVGALDDVATTKYYLGCKAFIFTAEEDFGITPVEAMAAGKPVISLGRAGAAETVVNGKTGVYFEKQTVLAVVGAIQAFTEMTFSSEHIKKHAENYSEDKFISRLQDIINSALNEKKK